MTKTRRQELSENLTGVEKLLVWQKDISSREFAESYVRLPKTNAFGAGQLVGFDKSPHIIKPMECFDDIYVQEIWLMFASQMAKTLFLFIIWAKTAKLNPKSMVWMISKIEAIARYQKEKIMDLVTASQELNAIIEESLEEQKKSRAKTGVIYHQGATTYLIGAKADDDKKSVTTKVVIVDEADEMDGVAAITPLWERAKTFLEAGAKLVVASTKKNKNGTITQGFNSCEQKNYLGIICPHCNETIEVHHRHFKIMEASEFKREFGYTDETFTEEVIYEKFIPYASKSAFYECNQCQGKITNELKKKQITGLKIDWIVKGVLENPRTVGFSANSFLSFFVPYEDIAKSYLKATMQSDPAVKQDMLEKFFEGYLNDYYDPKNSEVSQSDDILMLGSDLRRGELPENVVSIYMTIDTQKGHKKKEDDHYWYVIRAWDDKMNSYKLESGKIFHDKDIYGKIFTKYNIGERVVGIRRVIWDIQGHGEIETLAFIHQINSRIGAIYNDKDELKNYVVYPYRGESEIKGKTFRLQEEEKKTDDLLDTKYPIIIGNAKRGKDALSNAISRTVKYRKGDEVHSPDRNMWYIDEDEVEAGAKRLQNLKENGVKIPNEAYERQMTSEIYGEPPPSISKTSKKEGWYPEYKGRDNHYWDDEYMQFIAVEFDNLQERILSR